MNNVSFGIYDILFFVELALAIEFLFLLFFKSEKKWNKVIRIIVGSILSILYIVEIPMKAAMNKSYLWSVVLSIIWLLNVIITSLTIEKKDTK